MDVRDAVEADASALATLGDAPQESLRNAIHDRTVRVAEEPSAGTDGEGSEDGEDEESTTITGFVGFDARDGTVYVTQFGGSRAACELLLEEPVRFAEHEGMDVEVVVTATDETMRAAVEAVGFEKKGSGPMFDGERTVRYRLKPEPGS
ncbi:hypothetical protein SAMN04487949_0123 [Halogranum gelatinilyticum]|uniref:N-acetyltransferase domain-containing protein n=1 Tax=Halogranum gelatinilyticum TaxID=660521 RepID=A0A1G9NVK8_9EURY|nr:hypothetical protein [Halogranum gelatinilyticum]SDL90429.1 hypothetical protein SAMN04487949_0123 [Halogranum gelatinilyticum]